MSETIFQILQLRSSHVSAQRKAWLFFVSLALVAAVLVYLSDYTHSFLTRPWLMLVIVFLALNLLVGMVTFLIVSAYRQRSKLEAGDKDNFTLGIDALGRTVVAVGTLGSILPVFDIAFSQFLTSFSLVAVATVILFKDNIGNFLDGYRLMFSTDLLIGDYIKINDTSKGVIRDISFHHTRLKTDEGNILYIPNSQLINGEVTNLSKLKFKRISVPFTVTTEALGSVNTFETMLTKKLCAEFDDRIDPEKVFFRVTALEPEKAECALEVSVDHYSFKFERLVTKFVYQIVMEHTQASATKKTKK